MMFQMSRITLDLMYDAGLMFSLRCFLRCLDLLVAQYEEVLFYYEKMLAPVIVAQFGSSRFPCFSKRMGRQLPQRVFHKNLCQFKFLLLNINSWMLYLQVGKLVWRDIYFSFEYFLNCSIVLLDFNYLHLILELLQLFNLFKKMFSLLDKHEIRESNYYHKF